MKKLLFFSLLVALASCKKESNFNEKVEVQPELVKMERFDQLFYESSDDELPAIKMKYPFLFPNQIPDSEWLSKKQDPLLQELYSEVKLQFKNTDLLENELGDLFARIQYYFPKYKTTPKVIGLISEVDTEAKAIYADSLALISLDCYLGKDHRFYVDFPQYKKGGFERNQILPDLVENFAIQNVLYPQDNTFLSQMIYYGQKLYLKDVLLPQYSDGAKISYADDKIEWCKENEFQMWSYFIENNLLYDTNQKNEARFLLDAPFSKFYLEIDNQSPGRVGQWLGWQIVRSFMANNEVALHDMLRMDAKIIFERSKYKPQK